MVWERIVWIGNWYDAHVWKVAHLLQWFGVLTHLIILVGVFDMLGDETNSLQS